MKRQRLEAARALQVLSELKLRHERARADVASQAARHSGKQLDAAQQTVNSQLQGVHNALATAHGIGIVTMPLWAEDLRVAAQHRDEAQRADLHARDDARRQLATVHAAQALHEQVALRCRQALKHHLDERDARAVAEMLSTRQGEA